MSTQLMLATKQGDRAAFDRLVERIRGRAFHTARLLVGSRDDAMDLTQEAFMKVFRARDTFRDGEPFLPWFHRILRNTCFSHLRKKGRISRRSISTFGIEEDAPDYDLIDEAPGPDARTAERERSELLHQSFEGLSARDREILSLRHFQELSYKEIAEALDIPQGTVMSRLFHARRRLRERLGDTLDEVSPSSPHSQTVD
ncbi:MAG: RNA polymerase sigma factor [Planctomycetes bacterium]|nr:RNA polymerase sigma factor [Planctomycetota bacterium]